MKRRRLYLLGAVFILSGAAYILGWSSLFTVSDIEIQGTGIYLPINIEKGEKLARVEPRVVASSYEKYDFIERADVSRNWINGKVRITITERTPIAIYNNMAIDASGKSFIVRGQDVSQLPKIQAPTVDSAIIAAAFFRQLPADISSQVTVLKVHSGQTFIMQMKANSGTLELRWGRGEENLLKAKVYKALLLQPENSAVKRIDVSAPHAPIVK
ncbi:MAG: cell division protein FtsQ/DivIB [Candidatus Planktophila sp.]